MQADGVFLCHYFGSSAIKQPFYMYDRFVEKSDISIIAEVIITGKGVDRDADN